MQNVDVTELQQDLGFLRDIFASHAVRKEKAEKELQAVQAEIENLKASTERQIQTIVQQVQQDEANFLRQKQELEAQIAQRRAEKTNAGNETTRTVRTSETSESNTNRSSSDPNQTKSNTMLYVGIGAGVLILAGIAVYALKKK